MSGRSRELDRIKCLSQIKFQLSQTHPTVYAIVSSGSPSYERRGIQTPTCSPLKYSKTEKVGRIS